MGNSRTPTVGRIVHYLSRGSADGAYAPACRAAVVTDVDDDGAALAVLNPTGAFFSPAVPEGTAGGTWHWPGHDGDCQLEPAP